ncbi:hypothetical protein ACFVQ0_36480 [Streptomyces sp. NPDC057900]|uniref:hypothetical protein n=1 Tax=Streptomyces sp. NPDC057900 TaxID=3346274 RepID=UPI0036E39804
MSAGSAYEREVIHRPYGPFKVHSGLSDESKAARFTTMKRGNRLNAASICPLKGTKDFSRIDARHMQGANLNADSPHCCLSAFVHS